MICHNRSQLKNKTNILTKPSLQQEPYKYQIEVSIRVSEYRNVDAVKYLKCTATLAGADGVAVTVLTHSCVDEQPSGDKAGDIEELVEEKPEVPRGPVALDNEVQLNTAVSTYT